MFGQQSQQNQGLFGSNPFGQQSTSLFGQPQQQQQTSLFGGTTNTGLGTNTGTGGGLFGNATPQQNTGGLFGSSSTGTGLFGQTTTTPTSPFGQQTSPFGQQQQQPQSSLFGNTQSTSGGLFGSTPSFGTQNAASGLFSTPTKTNAFGTTIGGGAVGTAGVTFREQVDTTVGGKVQSILAMKEIADRNKTLEQLRYEDYTQQAANPQQQTSPFGQQSSTGTGGGLFGTSSTGGGLFSTQQKPAGTGLFGTSTTTGGGLFGSSPTTGQQSGGLFGSSPQQSGGGLFGNTTTAPNTGLFGSSTTTPATGGGLFGNTNTGGGLFGSKPATTGGGLFGSTAPSSGGGLFGSSTNTGGLFGGGSNTTSGGLFGSATTPTTTGGGLFGNTSNTGGGLFGNTTSPTTAGGGGLFGSQSNTGTGGGLFGSSNAGATGGGLFGSKPATGGGLFGNQTSSTGLFGSAQPQTNTATGTSGGGLFGTSTTQPSTGGLFGTSTTTQPSTGGLFGTSTTTQPSTSGGLFGNKPATTGSGLFGTNTTGGLFSNTSNSGGTGLFGTTTSPTTGGGGLFGNTGQTSTGGGGLFGSQANKPTGGLFGTPSGGGGGLFGTTTTSPMPNATSFQQQSPTPFVNPNAPLLNATITDTYHLSRLAIGNAAKLIWGNTYTVPSATRTRPSLMGDTDVTSSSWKPVPRVSYIDTVSASARTPRVSTVGRASSVTRIDRDSSLPRRDVFDGGRQGSKDMAKPSATPEERPKLALTAGEAVSGAQTQRASEPMPQRHPSRSYMESNADAVSGSASVRHFEPLPLDSIQPRDESPENITPWIPATGEMMGRRLSIGTTPCLTPRRTARDGFTSARRSPNSFRVPNDLAPRCSNPEIECRPSIKALRRFTEAELCQVADFEVIHASYGTVMWPGYTDVRGLDIDTTVDIQHQAVEVYGQKWHQQQLEIHGPEADIQEPPEGEGLNKEAIITLYNCKPVIESGMSQEEAYTTHKETLREYTKKMDAEFISLSQDWTWKFKVAHFSRYAMPMSSRSAVAPVRRGNMRAVTTTTSIKTIRKVEKAREEVSRKKLAAPPPLRLHFPKRNVQEQSVNRIPITSQMGTGSLDVHLDDKVQKAWSAIFKTPMQRIDKRDVQLALLQSLEGLELASAHFEIKSLYTLALSVLSTAHHKSLFHSIGNWLRHCNLHYLSTTYGTLSNETAIMRLRHSNPERLQAALLYILARETSQAAEILMPSTAGEGFPRLALLIESVGLHMMPNPDILQQLESFHKLNLFEHLDPSVSRILHLLAGNVEREVLAGLPTWHFSLTAILWFELSANLIMEEDPLESYSTHTTTLGLALEKLDRELGRQKKAGTLSPTLANAAVFSKPSEILYLRSIVDLKSGLAALIEEISCAKQQDSFLPILLSLIFHFAGDAFEDGAPVSDLLTRFATSLQGQDDSKLSRALYECLQQIFASHFQRSQSKSDLFLWKIVSGILCNVGVSTIIRSLEDLIDLLFSHLPLELLTANRISAPKYHTEIECLRYLENVLGCPRIFIVIALARKQSKRGQFVKAATYWLAASSMKDNDQDQCIVAAGTWWGKLGEVSEDVIRECVPSSERCVTESLSCLLESNEVQIRLRRLAALMTPPRNRQPLPTGDASEEFEAIWRLQTECLDGLTIRYAEELLPYDILQCLEAIHATVDLLRTKYLLTDDGSLDTTTVNALPSRATATSKSLLGLVSLWNHCRGTAILRIFKWLVASLRLVFSQPEVGNAVVKTSTEAPSFLKLLPEEVRQSYKIKAPETLVTLARSLNEERAPPVNQYSAWKEESRTCLEALRSAATQGRLFSDFLGLIESVTTKE